MSTPSPADMLIQAISEMPKVQIYGKVTAVSGLLVECSGLHPIVSVGSRCQIATRDGRTIDAEVVGLSGDISKLMPFEGLQGVGVGSDVWLVRERSTVKPHEQWQGRVLNAMGVPIDGKGAIPSGSVEYALKNSPIPAHERSMVEGKVDLGVRSINTFLTCCKGQRMGVFAGSGIGKSMLVAMLAKYSKADIKVIGLVGERGRELNEFLHSYLGEEGMKQSVVVVATSDQSALMRRQAAYLTLCVAEFFRDQGKDVLLMLDSVTRFAMAQREIGLSAGEPPTSKGYTPTTFVELPQLLERAGPGKLGSKGSITALFTVLVEGDDHNEPVSDAVRGILDGHIVLDRSIAERGRYPAINILRSISRTLPGCNTAEQNQMISKARNLMATYNNMEEMIRLGAYRKGSDKVIDEAIYYNEPLEGFLRQEPNEQTTLEEGYQRLEKILKGKVAEDPAKPTAKK